MPPSKRSAILLPVLLVLAAAVVLFVLGRQGLLGFGKPNVPMGSTTGPLSTTRPATVFPGSAPGAAQVVAPPGQLRARVVDATGAPLAGAEVWLTQHEALLFHPDGLRLVTDDQGRFTVGLPDTPAGMPFPAGRWSAWLLEEGAFDERRSLRVPEVGRTFVVEPEAGKELILVAALGATVQGRIDFESPFNDVDNGSWLAPLGLWASSSSGGAASFDQLIAVVEVQGPQAGLRTLFGSSPLEDQPAPGSFTFTNLPPGEYVMRFVMGWGGDNEPIYCARRITIGQADITLQTLALTLGDFAVFDPVRIPELGQLSD